MNSAIFITILLFLCLWVSAHDDKKKLRREIDEKNEEIEKRMRELAIEVENLKMHK